MAESPANAPQSYKVLALVKTDRIWEPRKWHLTRKRFYYEVEGKTDPVVMLQKIKGVPSKIKHNIDIHQIINTTCTLAVTGLQFYQSGVLKKQ